MQSLSTIGEVAKRVSAELRARHPDVPWAQLIAFRNILVHAYFGLNVERIWIAASGEAPVLGDQIASILRVEYPATKQEDAPPPCSGQGGGPFADVALQTHRPIAKSGRASLSAGAGIWGGGQDNVMRLDVGPNIRANIMAGGAQFQLDASWRFRVAGQAQPGNGPAVTLSTSF